MRIWILNPYVLPPSKEVRFQTIKRAEYLAKQDAIVEVFGDSNIHNSSESLLPFYTYYQKERFLNFTIWFIRSLKYKEDNRLRILSLVSFYFGFWLLNLFRKKPDVIILTSTAPINGGITFFCKIFRIKLVVDVLDLWPESFFAYGILERNSFLAKWMFMKEQKLYSEADLLFFVMRGAKDYLNDKLISGEHTVKIDDFKIRIVSNGIDLAEFDHNQKGSDASLFRLKESDFNLVYIGSLRHANDLRSLLHAMELLKEYDSIKLYIYGSGPLRKNLELLAISLDLNNVYFEEEWVDYSSVPALLKCSHLNVMFYGENSVMKYGGAQSKSFLYLASGKPTLSNLTSQYCVFNNSGSGISAAWNSSREIADTILSFFNMSKEEYSDYCERARDTASQYDYAAINLTVMNELKQIIYD